MYRFCKSAWPCGLGNPGGPPLPLFPSPSSGQQTLIYLFPGQGADYRQFKNIRWPEGYDTIHMNYPLPEKGERMHDFACRLIPYIDQDRPFILLGVSLGGMICTELADTLDPLHVILISSAKTCFELPAAYTLSGKLQMNRLLPARLIKACARLLQGIVEPARRQYRETCSDMLRQKDPQYLKRSAEMIVSWNRVEYNSRIIHIHGDRDHTLPAGNVLCNYLVKGGSHMMVLTRAGEISEILYEILQ